MFIMIALKDLHPISIAAGRLLVGCLLLLTLLKIKGLELPPFGKVWGHFFIMGSVANAIPFILFGLGEQHISSAMAGIINGSTPIFTVILAHYFIASEPLTIPKTMGVFSGVIGLSFLLAPTLMDGTIEGDTFGIFAVAGAAICYALGMVYARCNLPPFPPLVIPAAQMLAASLYMIPLAIIVPSYDLPVAWSSIAAVCSLGVFGTGAAFVLYYRVLERSGASVVAMSTYLLPVFSSILGVLFLGEEFHWTTAVGASFILLGMMIVNGSLNFLFKKRRSLKV